jgi:hypothetical protein
MQTSQLFTKNNRSQVAELPAQQYQHKQKKQHDVQLRTARRHKMVAKLMLQQDFVF